MALRTSPGLVVGALTAPLSNAFGALTARLITLLFSLSKAKKEHKASFTLCSFRITSFFTVGYFPSDYCSLKFTPAKKYLPRGPTG